MDDKKTLMERIWQEMNECAMIQNGKSPDNVMLHPSKKHEILEQANLVSGHVYYDGIKEKCFGMSIIYTITLKENEIKCTYDGRKHR